MRTSLFTAVVSLFGVVVSTTATTRGNSLRRLRENSDDSQRFLKKDKDEGKDDCLDLNEIFRVCNNRRRNLVSSRLLKKDKDDEAPMADNGYNIEIGDFELTLGASLLSQSGDCDCREELEEAVLEYLDETFSNNDYEILCVALTDLAAQGSDTLATFTLTFQVRDMFEADFEAQGSCSAEDLVLCCMAAEIGTAMNPQRSCVGCDLNFCATPDSGETLVEILNDEVDECGNVIFQDAAVVDPPATALPTTLPTLAPVPGLADTSSPTVSPTPGVPNTTLAPTVSPTAGVPPDTTLAPTDSPTAGVPPDTTLAPTDSPTPGVPPDTTRAPTDSPTPGVPPDTTRAPTDSPTPGVPPDTTLAPTDSPTPGVPPDTTLAPTDSPTPGLPIDTTRAPTDSPTPGIPLDTTTAPTMLPTFPITMEPSDVGDLSVPLGDLSVPFTGDMSVPFGDLSVPFATSLPN